MPALSNELTDEPDITLHEEMSFVKDLFEDFGDDELEDKVLSMRPWEVPILDGCGYRISDIRELPSVPELEVESDERHIIKPMNWGNSRHKGCSIELIKGSNLDLYARTAQWLREQYFPHHTFQCCQ